MAPSVFRPSHTAKKAQAPTLSFHSYELETIRPLSNSAYLNLLRTKPVSDWEKATSFLVSRHLLLLPSKDQVLSSLPASEFLSSPDTDSGATFKPGALDRQAARVKEQRAKQHAQRLSDQKEAKAARAHKRANAHALRLKEQQAAKAKRASVKAARSPPTPPVRPTANSDPSLPLREVIVKSGQEAVRVLTSRRAAILSGMVAAGCTEDSALAVLCTAAPLLPSRQSKRPVRSAFDADRVTPMLVARSSVTMDAPLCIARAQSYISLLTILDSHLVYVFNECSFRDAALNRRLKLEKSATRPRVLAGDPSPTTTA